MNLPHVPSLNSANSLHALCRRELKLKSKLELTDVLARVTELLADETMKESLREKYRIVYEVNPLISITLYQLEHHVAIINRF